MLKQYKFWVPVYVLTIAATQIGGLAREVWGWDESTHILMAANVLDGNLPYVELIVTKPPLIFLMLAGVMVVFGESLWAVRLFGDLCILASCIAVFGVARRWTDPISSGLGGLIFIAICATDIGQPTSTELPATAMLMMALWFLLAKENRLWAVATAGLLMSLAVLTRTNLGIVAAAFGVWLLVSMFRSSSGSTHRWAFTAYAIAGLIPLGILTFIYWTADALWELWVGVFDASFSYAVNQEGVVDVSRSYVGHWSWHIWSMPYVYGIYTLATAVGMVVSATAWKGHGPNRAWREEGLLWLMFGSISLSLVVGGKAHAHHWLQLFPICAIFCARALGWTHSKAGPRRVGYSLALVCLAGALWKTTPSAVRLVTVPGWLAERHYIRSAADAIVGDREPGDEVWALRHHLILWYLDAMPISKLAHPSDFGKKDAVVKPLVAAGLLSENELQRVIEIQPTYLVTDPGKNAIPWYLGDMSDDVRDLIDNHYRVFHDNGRISVYKRLDVMSPGTE